MTPGRVGHSAVCRDARRSRVGDWQRRTRAALVLLDVPSRVEGVVPPLVYEGPLEHLCPAPTHTSPTGAAPRLPEPARARPPRLSGTARGAARGETRGERRKRRRRDRTSAPPYPDHSTPPRPRSDEEQLAMAMAERPAWVKAVWATPERRLVLSVGFLAVAARMLISALSDPDAFFEHGRSAVGFVAAPLIPFMFGCQAVEAIGELHKRDSVPARERNGPGLLSPRMVARPARALPRRPLPRRHGHAPLP
jgi:hypothetical protein